MSPALDPILPHALTRNLDAVHAVYDPRSRHELIRDPVPECREEMVLPSEGCLIQTYGGDE
jgi:hypothetical protein